MRTPLLTPAPAAAPEQETPPRRTVAAWSLPVWAAVLASAAAGLLLDFASAPVGWWPLTFVSVAVALVALIGRSFGGALLVGTVFGAVFFATHLVWVGEFLGPVPWLALAGLEAVLFGAGAVPIALAYRWTARYRLVRVEFPTTPVDPFFNVNRPEDIAAAEVQISALEPQDRG